MKKIDVTDLAKALQQPGQHKRLLKELMLEYPEILVAYAEKIAPYVSFTAEYADLVEERLTWGMTHSNLSTPAVVNLLNAGVTSYVCSTKWQKHGATKGLKLNLTGLVACDNMGRDFAALMSNNYVGCDGKDDAMRAASLPVGPSFVSPKITEAFHTLPDEWWPDMARCFSHRRLAWVAVKKMSWQKRADLYQYFQEGMLPRGVYAPEEELQYATIRGSLGGEMLLNKSLSMQLKMKGLRDFSKRASAWSDLAGYRAPPKYIMNPNTVTLDLTDQPLTNNQADTLCQLMLDFKKVKVKGASKLKESLLSGSSRWGERIARWANEKRLK